VTITVQPAPIAASPASHGRKEGGMPKAAQTRRLLLEECRVNHLRCGRAKAWCAIRSERVMSSMIAKPENVASLVRAIRGEKVLLDADLAAL
jgi:hypothetical protein